MVYNKESGEAVWAGALTGSTFIYRDLPLINTQWRQVPQNFKKFRKLYKTIRDPYTRWRSWFFRFAVNGRTNNLLPAYVDQDIHKWIEIFADTMHYNDHTQYQSIFYRYEKEYCRESDVYIWTRDINSFFDYTKERKFNLFHEGSDLKDYIDKEAQPLIKELYAPDYEWHKTISSQIFLPEES